MLDPHILIAADDAWAGFLAVLEQLQNPRLSSVKKEALLENLTGHCRSFRNQSEAIACQMENYIASDAADEVLPGSSNTSREGAMNAIRPVTQLDFSINNQSTEGADFNKLISDIASGASAGTLQNDAAKLATDAGKAGDAGLEGLAINIGDSLKDGSYDPNTSLVALGITAPGSAKAQSPLPPTGDALTDAYLKLERDIASGADQQTINADAQQVVNLATQEGLSSLASVATDIIGSLVTGSYDPMESLNALMNTPANSDDENLMDTIVSFAVSMANDVREEDQKTDDKLEEKREELNQNG